MDTKLAQSARSLQLNSRQKEIVIGSMLGDGYLTATTRGFAFRVNHSFQQQEYVDWKYAQLKMFTNSSPRKYENSYYFRTVSHPFFGFLRQKFYVKNIKILPKNINKWLTPLALTVWIMEDGSKDYNQLRINSQSFSRKENEALVRVLKAKFGITATINRDKDRFRLRIAAISMPILRQLIAPFIIPSMQYKFSP